MLAQKFSFAVFKSQCGQYLYSTRKKKNPDGLKTILK